MRWRGIALSLDALFALAFVAVMFSLPVMFAQHASDYSGFDDLSILGRDYLVLRYYYNKTITTDNFTSLTGQGISESAPSDSWQWVYATYYRYPRFFDCANSTNCTFANTSSSAGYGLAQDTGLTHKYVVWVKP